VSSAYPYKFNSKCVTNPLAGYNFDTTNVTNEVAAISNVVAQYLKPLTTGVVDPDSSITTFVNALNQNGASTIMKEEQKQINSFLSQSKKSK